jgi:hypothetical protein
MSPHRQQQSSPGCRRPLRAAIFAAVLALSFSHGAALAADVSAPAVGRGDLPRVKAAIIFNICKFVDWPAAGGEPGDFVIGVLGCNDDGPNLAILEGKRIQDRAVCVVAVTDATALAACHAAYVGRAGLASETWSALAGLPLLTFGEERPPGAPGGMIELVSDSDRVRFDVHKAAAERAGLQLSSQLLKLARSVKDD